uniref:Uncharacterized protein n=1 Tax=Romanomermis culicivorax TaxID=13658 RepID=A0A915HSN9_ROMCU
MRRRSMTRLDTKCVYAGQRRVQTRSRTFTITVGRLTHTWHLVTNFEQECMASPLLLKATPRRAEETYLFLYFLLYSFAIPTQWHPTLTGKVVSSNCLEMLLQDF